jgi:hypothetical protein
MLGGREITVRSLERVGDEAYNRGTPARPHLRNKQVK